MNSESDLEQRIANYRLSDPMIILVGPMGAGKTTIGRRLAQNLHLNFVDLDRKIEEEAGLRIPEIFELEGEAGFRTRETAALETHCCLSGTVIATGGGAILSPENRKMMRSGIVVFLYATPYQQYLRIRNRTHRPNFDPNRPVERLTELMETREPLYREEADFVVNSDNQTVESIARKIEDYLLEH